MRRSLLIISILLSIIYNGYAQQIKEAIPLKHGAHRTGKRADAAMAKWRAYGLGQFIHWGLYAIPGGEWDGIPYNGASEWIRSWDEVSKPGYDSLIYKFNPAKFNPDSWAETAKQMGARYVTITTKHHDGFCLWPTKYTGFNISYTPYKKDIIGQLVNAYNKQGIDVILYFSVMDWHNPDWRYEIKTKDDSTAFERFKKFTRNQLIELLTLYPTVKGLWFDGTWDKSWASNGAFGDELEQELRKLHPGLIIGSRFHADEYGKRHFDSNGNLMGDYEQGWERKIPNNITDIHGNDWECVMTVPENMWGYNKSWEGHIKTADELIEMLSRCVSLDGNFVLNFGPKPDGAIRPEELNLAKAIGDWMKINSDAIYNCGYAGFDRQDWGYYTKSRDNADKNYMLVFNVPISGALRIKLPAGKTIQKVYLLANPEVTFDPEQIAGSEYFIHLKKTEYTKPFVIVLKTANGHAKQAGDKAKT